MKILLAIDGSPYSVEAIKEVVSRPWPSGSMVRVLSAINIVPTPIEWLYDAGEILELEQQEVVSRTEQLARKAAESLAARGLGVEIVVRNGDPRSVIVEEAREWMADLIVLGSHEYAGIERMSLDGVTQSVVSHAPCSIELVRHKLATTASEK